MVPFTPGSMVLLAITLKAVVNTSVLPVLNQSAFIRRLHYVSVEKSKTAGEQTYVSTIVENTTAMSVRYIYSALFQTFIIMYAISGQTTGAHSALEGELFVPRCGNQIIESV
jgi:hypothetical protein